MPRGNWVHPRFFDRYKFKKKEKKDFALKGDWTHEQVDSLGRRPALYQLIHLGRGKRPNQYVDFKLTKAVKNA